MTETLTPYAVHMAALELFSIVSALGVFALLSILWVLLLGRR